MNLSRAPITRGSVDYWAAGFLLAVAAGLQFQFVLPIGSVNLKLCPADPIVLAGMALVIAKAIRHRVAPWPPDFKIVLLAFPTAALTMGLAVSYIRHGHVSNWALVGKYAGWFVLGAYLLMAAELVRLAGSRALASCLRAFCWLTVAMNSLFYIERIAYILYLPSDDLLNAVAPWKLLLYGDQSASPISNDNGSAVMLICVLAIVLSNRIKSGDIFRGTAAFALAALTCMNIVLTGSRAGIGAAALLLAIVLLVGAPARRMVAGLLVVVGLFLGGLQFGKEARESAIGTPDRREFAYQNRAEGGKYDASVVGRTEAINAALRMWLDHPILGSGLGSFLAAQGKDGLIIHNTTLWIVTEMGIVGFAAYAIFFTGIVTRLTRNLGGQDAYGVAASAALLALVSIGAMSMFHELLYQRAPWFILGLAMAAGSDPRPWSAKMP